MDRAHFRAMLDKESAIAGLPFLPGPACGCLPASCSAGRRRRYRAVPGRRQPWSWSRRAALGRVARRRARSSGRPPCSSRAARYPAAQAGFVLPGLRLGLWAAATSRLHALGCCPAACSRCTRNYCEPFVVETRAPQVCKLLTRRRRHLCLVMHALRSCAPQPWCVQFRHLQTPSISATWVQAQCNALKSGQLLGAVGSAHQATLLPPPVPALCACICLKAGCSHSGSSQLSQHESSVDQLHTWAPAAAGDPGIKCTAFRPTSAATLPPQACRCARSAPLARQTRRAPAAPCLLPRCLPAAASRSRPDAAA